MILSLQGPRARGNATLWLLLAVLVVLMMMGAAEYFYQTTIPAQPAELVGMA